jgi:hypothetical protein
MRILGAVSVRHRVFEDASGSKDVTTAEARHVAMSRYYDAKKSQSRLKRATLLRNRVKMIF